LLRRSFKKFPYLLPLAGAGNEGTHPDIEKHHSHKPPRAGMENADRYDDANIRDRSQACDENHLN